MAAATTCPALNGYGQAFVLALELLQRYIATMPDVDVDHDQAGDGTGYDPDPGLWPRPIPAECFRLIGMSVLKVLPSNQWSFVSGPDRDDRPASRCVIADCIVH
jgi:hypothetical protein